MMSLKSKCELLEVVRPRYLKANKAEKQKILDEFTSATGYHRKHAIRILKNQVQVQNHLKGKTKTYKTIYAPDMSLTVVLTATWIHNIFFVFFILAFLGHMAAIILKPNQPMVRGILTGAVRLDYARHRHPLWLEDIEKMEVFPVPVEQTPLAEIPHVIEETEISQVVETGKETVNQDKDRDLENIEAS